MRNRLGKSFGVAGLGVAAASAAAAPVSTREELVARARNAITIDFSELRGKTHQAFGSPEVGQPYAVLGLVLPSQVIDGAADDAAPPSKDGKGKHPIFIQSTGLSTADNSTYQSLAFTRPQKAVGFMVKSPRATSITVTALDRNGQPLGMTILPEAKDPKFVGLIFDTASIAVVRIVALHATLGDAEIDPASVTEVTFGAGDGEESSTNGAAPGGAVGDFALAEAVSAYGAPTASAQLAYNGGANGALDVGGTGGAGTNAGGRNPGNRNPNLPPAIIPEAAMAGVLGGFALPLGLRPRRRR